MFRTLCQIASRRPDFNYGEIMQTQYITIEDLQAVVNLVDVVCTRGGLRGNELSPIARLRDVCEHEAKYQTEERIKQQQETAEQMAAQAETKSNATENALADERQQRKELQERIARLESQIRETGDTPVGKAIKMTSTSAELTQPAEPKKPSRAVKMAQMMRGPADEFVAGDVTESTPSAVEDAANVMSDYVPPIDEDIAPIPPVLPETDSKIEELMSATRKKAEEEMSDTLSDNPFEDAMEEEVVEEKGDTLVIPDKKELNTMTKAVIKEVADGLGLSVDLKDTKANMIKSFDKQAKKMIKELTEAGDVESSTESEWVEATYIKD